MSWFFCKKKLSDVQSEIHLVRHRFYRKICLCLNYIQACKEVDTEKNKHYSFNHYIHLLWLTLHRKIKFFMKLSFIGILENKDPGLWRTLEDQGLFKTQDSRRSILFRNTLLNKMMIGSYSGIIENKSFIVNIFSNKKYI